MEVTGNEERDGYTTEDTIKIIRGLVLQGYAINRLVSEAIQLFGDIEDSESFFTSFKWAI